MTTRCRGDGITITRYYGPGGRVAIPGRIDGRPVVRIGAGAFDYQESITGISMPDSVTEIGCYHPPTGTWYLFRSREGYLRLQFGFAGTLLMGGSSF